jgi:hypothetical protein
MCASDTSKPAGRNKTPPPLRAKVLKATNASLCACIAPAVLALTSSVLTGAKSGLQTAPWVEKEDTANTNKTCIHTCLPGVALHST